MAIDGEWAGEDGATLARYEGPVGTVALLGRADPASVCVGFLGPWGNATFNQQQLPVLMQELESLQSRTPDGQREVIEALLAFLRPARDQVHTYIKFIGD